MLIIGDGEERQNLEKMTSQEMVRGTFHFTNAIYDPITLANMLYHSDLCVSPGNIGLMAIHALSYGTPVCTHSNFNNQMPEAEAIIEGENGFFFEEDSIESLISGISKWFENDNIPNKSKIRNIVDQFYNPSYQYEVFKNVVN